MDIQLYNSLFRKKQQFIPIDHKNVRMYVCGPTVYDVPHIGNARPVIVFDILFRMLIFKYTKKNVTYIRNITDVDDKIYKKAAEDNITIQQLTKKNITCYQQNMQALCNLEPDIEPRATEHIKEMIEFIQKLIKQEYAYQTQGHVLFNVRKFRKYGQLSGKLIEHLIDGVRVENADYKKNPADFLLWKKAKENETSWQSPWGKGRPGWHIECSAMAKKYFGEIFDIHAGGIDLIFPHHENEIAQSCAANGHEKLANIWMHNGQLAINGKKMAKSSGNVLNIESLLQDYKPETIRMAMISTHYRQPINFSEKLLEQANNINLKFNRIIEQIENYPQHDYQSIEKEAQKQTFDIIADDLNTPKIIAVWSEWANKAQKQNEYAVKLKESLKIIGFEYQKQNKKIDENEILQLIKKRQTARENKQFYIADEIRQYLKDKGVLIEDQKNQTVWKYQNS